MVEENEELIEQWWFKVFAKSVDTPLAQWLCERRLKHCCPKGTYGAECKDCTGGKDEPCSGHGSCDGDGTRGGSGKCKCSFGYAGDVCSVCGERFYEDFEEDGITKTCSECDKSCREGCTDGSPKGCHECKEGWVKSEEDGCIDYDECAEDEASCAADEYCSNTIGSKNCLKCDEACDGCTGRGVDKCKACRVGYEMIENECKDIDECVGGDVCLANGEQCLNQPGKYSCSCKDGYKRKNKKCIKSEPKKAAKKSSSKKSKTKKVKDYTMDNIQFFTALLGFGLVGIFLRDYIIVQSVAMSAFWSYLWWFSCRFDKSLMS
ncbi:hypothetical protein CAPTEDRAFT_152135 [Capitella teleta]|uniref:protein disulfide-isomerase n=1 Tax=Capitella teleta TaxID=283909 RepID=R7V808_CAPTE|nr:hypothetical protein CAPTEDRAFT_152135 [Capitella teleta]|eukprot:ELU11890.1 hypothetical protein CAPTEDRAFT_152135 [Capitella teleta]